MSELKNFLHAQDLSVTLLAKRVKMSVPHVWRMVNDQSAVSDAFRWRFQQAFGAEASERVFGTATKEQHVLS